MNAIFSSVLMLLPFLLSLYVHAGQSPGMPLLQLLAEMLVLLLQLPSVIKVSVSSNVFMLYVSS
jgi:hypothetical protein